MVSSMVHVPPFHQILWKSVYQFLRNPDNKQTNKRRRKHNLLGGVNKTANVVQQPGRNKPISHAAAAAAGNHGNAS